MADEDTAVEEIAPEVDPHEVTYTEDDEYTDDDGDSSLPDPDRRRKLKRIVILVGAVLVAIVALIIFLVAMGHRDAATAPSTSEAVGAVVEDYMQALSDGDAKSALVIAPLEGDVKGNPFVRQTTYADTARRIASFKVGKVKESANHATASIDVRYRATKKGDPRTVTLTARQTAKGWVLQPVNWGTVELPLGLGKRVTISGHRFTLPKDQTGTVAYPVLPGRYSVKAVGTPAYLSVSTAKLRTGTVNFDTRLRPGIKAEIRMQLDQLLSRCIFAHAEVRDMGCPNWVKDSPANPYVNVLWSIEEMPTYRIALQPDGSVLIATNQRGTIVLDDAHVIDGTFQSERLQLPGTVADHAVLTFDRNGVVSVKLDDHRVPIRPVPSGAGTWH